MTKLSPDTVLILNGRMTMRAVQSRSSAARSVGVLVGFGRPNLIEASLIVSIAQDLIPQRRKSLPRGLQAIREQGPSALQYPAETIEH